jgi:O-antigen/teichoic acid export membrane protein
MYRLPAHEVGFFSLSMSSILLISTLISCGLRQLFMLEFFNLNSQNKKEFVNDIIGIYLILSLFFWLLILAGYSYVNTFLFAKSANKVIYFCCMLQAFLTFFTELFYQALMYTLKSVHVTAIKACHALFILCASVLGVSYFNAHIESVIFMQCACSFALTACALRYYCHYTLFDHFHAQRVRIKYRTILAASAPLLPTVLAGLLLASGNRWVLSLHANLADIAVYSLAEYVAPLFNLIILYPLSGAYLPRIMAQFNQKSDAIETVELENKRLMWMSMAALFVAGTSAYLLAKPLIVYFLPPNYSTAVPGAYAVFIGNLLLMGTYFTSSILLFKKKSYHLLFCIACAALTNVSASYILVPYYGINGCFISYVAAYGLYFLLMYWGNRAVVRACATHVAAQEDTQKILGFVAAAPLQEEALQLSNNKKESSSVHEDRNF